jgi:hypothetical protein
MTWRAGEVAPAVAAFALGQYRVVTRRPGSVAVSVWLLPADTVQLAVVDSLAASIQLAWKFCSRAFGRLPIEEWNIATAEVPALRGFTGFLLMRHDAGSDGPPSGSSSDPALGRVPDALVREVARTWWGNSVSPAGPASAWILEGLPAWAAVAARGVIEGDTVRQRLVREAEASWRATVPGRDDPLSRVPIARETTNLLRTKGIAAIEAVRRAVGEARFREFLLSLAVDHRNASVTLNDVLSALGPDGAAVLRPYLF